MFIRILTLPTQLRAFDDMEATRKVVCKSVYPVLKNQEGWIKTDIIFNKETKQFKAISYWSSKEETEDKEPKLSIMEYMQVGKFVEFFDTENITVEYFQHLATMKKTTNSEN